MRWGENLKKCNGNITFKKPISSTPSYVFKFLFLHNEKIHKEKQNKKKQSIFK